MSIDPFMINLTNSVLVCIAPNGIMLWRFESNNTDESHSIPHGADLVARRRIRTFHIDESPSIIGDSTEEAKLKEAAKDPASCSDAAGQMLIVCRESGKLQVYSLPHGALMNTIDTAYEVRDKSEYCYAMTTFFARKFCQIDEFSAISHMAEHGCLPSGYDR